MLPTAIRLPPTIINRALYRRVLALWFADHSPHEAVATEAVVKRWFGLSGVEQRKALDDHCRGEFGAALEALGPQTWESGGAAATAGDSDGGGHGGGREDALRVWKDQTTWLDERRHDAEVAGAFFHPDVWQQEESGTGREEEKAEKDARDALGLVILLDQIPRNVFRSNEEQGLVYSHYDRLARAVARTMLFTSHPEDGVQPPRLTPLRPDRHPAFRTRPAWRLWFYLPLMHSEHMRDHERYEELVGPGPASMVADAEDSGDEKVIAEAKKSIDWGKRHAKIIEKFGRYPYRNAALSRETTHEEKQYLEGGGETFGVKT